MKKTKIFAAAAIAIGLAAAGIGAADASTTTSGTNPMSGLVAAIAQKFNLNPTDVQQVFTQQKTQMDAQRQQAAVDRINAAVTAGKLTQAQANLIIAKQAELKATEATFAAMTPADRQAAVKAQMASLKQWLTDNNIPAGYFPLGIRGMVRGRMGHGFGRPGMNQASPTPTPAAGQ